MGALAEYTLYRELYVLELLASGQPVLTPVIRRWLHLVQSIPDCLFVCPLGVTPDAALLQYHLEYHHPPPLGQSLIQSDLIRESLRTPYG